MRRLLAVFRQNPLAEAFVDERGVVRPIRRSDDYSQAIVDERARQRQATGQTAREQQDVARFERFLARSEGGPRRRVRRIDPEEQLYRLERESEALREAIAESGVDDLVELFSEHGQGRSERGLIPFGVARRLLPRPPEHYRTAIVQHAGRPYLRWEYVTDELAEERGFSHVQDLRDAIERVRRQRRRLGQLDSEIRRLERSTRRRNPSILARVWAWLAGVLADPHAPPWQICDRGVGDLMIITRAAARARHRDPEEAIRSAAMVVAHVLDFPRVRQIRHALARALARRGHLERADVDAIAARAVVAPLGRPPRRRHK